LSQLTRRCGRETEAEVSCSIRFNGTPPGDSLLVVFVENKFARFPIPQIPEGNELAFIALELLAAESGNCCKDPASRCNLRAAQTMNALCTNRAVIAP